MTGSKGTPLWLAVLGMVLIGSIAKGEAESETVSWFMEPHEATVPVDPTPFSNVDEVIFNEIIDHVEEIYKPIVERAGGELIIHRKWRNGTINASARKRRSLWQVDMYGGLARHPAVTPDAFALVVCHELGHHLGGAPKKFFPHRWATYEGQSDYYAVTKCFRTLFEDDDNVAIVQDMFATNDPYVSDFAYEMCSLVHVTPNEAALCVRAVAAGMSVSYMFYELRNMSTLPSVETPDPKVVRRTSSMHPDVQCRLDTYFQGALCTVSHWVDFDRKDPNIGACTRDDGFLWGVRPLCWYKPPFRKSLASSGGR